jgi:SulP family sulfate permease
MVRDFDAVVPGTVAKPDARGHPGRAGTVGSRGVDQWRRVPGHPPVYDLGRKPGTEVFRPLQDHPNNETFPGLLLVRTEGRIYFANTPRVREKAQALVQQAQPQVIVVHCSAVPDIEYTALKGLTDLEERLREAWIALWLAALNPEPLRTVQQSSLGDVLGRERMFVNLEQAVETSQARQM